MKYNSRSIYGCGIAPEEFKEPQDCRYTYNPEKKILYLHLFAWPFRQIRVENLAGRARYMQLLQDGSAIGWGELDGNEEDRASKAIMIYLPILKPDSVVPVIEIFLND